MVKTPDLALRDHAEELFKLLSEKNVLCHLLSAGIYDVIHAFLKEKDMEKYGMHVVSNMMHFDENGKLDTFVGEIIHTENKNACVLTESKAWDDVKVSSFVCFEVSFCDMSLSTRAGSEECPNSRRQPR